MDKRIVIKRNIGKRNGKYLMKCLNCGNLFKISRARYKDGRGKYCSRKCISDNKKVLRKCLNCGVEFQVNGTEEKKHRRYCSMKCRKEHNKISVKCLYCGKEFTVSRLRYNNSRGKYCSKKCYSDAHSVITKCSSCGKEIKIRLANYEKHNKHYCSIKCRGEGERGNKNISWIDGRTPVRQLIRKCAKYKRWEYAVKKRDNFMCCDCKNSNSKLVAHHKIFFSDIWKKNNIKTFNDAIKCKELWDINNGETLCRACHQTRHPNIPILK